MINIVEDSLWFKLAIRAIAFWALLSIALLLVSILGGQPQLGSKVLVQMVPIGILGTVIYSWRKSIAIKRKIENFSRELHHVAQLVIRNAEEGFDRFDEFLSLQKTRWKKGPVSPYLLATVRILEKIQELIAQPDLNPRKKLRSSLIGKKLASEVYANQLIFLCKCLMLSDNRLIYETLSNLLFLVTELLRTDSNDEEFGIYPETEFVNDLNKISVALKCQRFWEASDLHTELLQRLNMCKNEKTKSFEWQFLLGHWLSIHIKELSGKIQSERSILFLEPTKTLSLFIDQALEAFKSEDHAELAEVLTESFDWRFRVVKYLVVRSFPEEVKHIEAW